MYSVIILFHLKNTTADILINIKKAVIHKHFIVPARKLLGIRDSIKSSIKGGVAGVHYSKLAMDEAEDDVLGLELGLGGFGGIRNGTEEIGGDELNRLI